ncbi:hypothetical protein ACBR40_15185 [Nonomuraea sp. AD125B]
MQDDAVGQADVLVRDVAGKPGEVAGRQLDLVIDGPVRSRPLIA